jgi:hypothetical protein
MEIHHRTRIREKPKAEYKSYEEEAVELGIDKRRAQKVNDPAAAA